MTKIKKYDVITVGELNVDLILNDIESFPEIGKEKLAGEMTLTLGSSSAIFASNLSSLGAKVAFIGKIGKDSFGKTVIESLKNKNVSTDFISFDEKEKTGATIVLNFDEDRANVTYPGAMNNLSIADITDEKLSTAKHMHVSSVFLQPKIKENIIEIFEKAKKLGLTTSLDPQWDPFEKWDLNLKELLPYVDVFLPNEAELINLTGEFATEKAVRKIAPYAQVIAVKKGAEGSLVYTNGKFSEMPAFLNENVVDAIGAGDSFDAGFIFKFVKNASLAECQLFGNLCGAVNTVEAGGTTAFDNYETVMKIAREKFGVNNIA
jgi:sugar/nucleoside kinase (ribokinase family)